MTKPGVLSDLDRLDTPSAWGNRGAGAAFLLLAAVQLGWQVATLDIGDARNCLSRFKSNQLVGWLLFLGLSADMAVAALFGR